MGQVLQLSRKVVRPPRGEVEQTKSGVKWDDVLDMDKARANGTKQGSTKTERDYKQAMRDARRKKAQKLEDLGELPPWRMRMEHAVEEVCEGSSYSKAAKDNFLSASEVRRYCLKNNVRSPDMPEVRKRLITTALAYDLERRIGLSNKAFMHLEEILDDVQTADQMRSWANAFGILVDKRRLEEGQATMRVETLNGGAKALLENKMKELAEKAEEKRAIEAQSRVLDSHPMTDEELQVQMDMSKPKSFIPDEGTYEGTFEVIDPSGNKYARDTTLRGPNTIVDPLSDDPSGEDDDDLSEPRFTDEGEEDWSHLNNDVTEPKLVDDEDLVLA